MTARHVPSGGSAPGDRFVQVGAAVFVVGLLAVVVAVVPSVATGSVPPLPVVVTAGSLLPLGFGLALIGLLRGARTARRAARREQRAATDRDS